MFPVGFYSSRQIEKNNVVGLVLRRACLHFVHHNFLGRQKVDKILVLLRLFLATIL